MRILMLHNYYQQPGGEDECFAAESALLEAHGHEVDRFVVHNDQIRALPLAAVATGMLWNRHTYRALRERIRHRRPDVLHAHNTFPLISPSAYYAAGAEGVPVVQTIHNYRLSCVNALFFRNGRPCEDCTTRALPWPGVVHRCYRNSRMQSGGVASMLALHRAAGTWHKRVDAFVALTQFAKAKLVSNGISEAKIHVKPNFLGSDPGIGPDKREGFALFVGRLVPEKGVGTLVRAWSHVPPPLRLRIIGDGPFAAQAKSLANGNPSIEFLGRTAPSEVLSLMRKASVVVVPSEWYETFGRVVIEAFAAGTPVVAARIGAIAELVDDGHTGRLFEPGSAGDLAQAIWELLRDEASYRRMRAAARAKFEECYTAAANYTALMSIYRSVCATTETDPALTASG